MEALNLLPAIHQKEFQFEKEIKPYKESLCKLRSINTACEKCNGKGWTLRHRVCAEDDRPDPNDPSDRITCSCCGGSGIYREPIKKWMEARL